MGSCPVQAGNIQAKMGVGTYEYGQGAGPHALTRVGARLFYYDANGNLEEERRDGNFGVVRGFRYTGADQVRRVEVPGRSAVFHYGADRARVIRKDYDGTTLKTRTDYIGNVEVVRPVGGHAEYRRYIGGVVIATWYEQTGVSQERYLHKDHLGSTVAISSSAGYVEHLLAYDPWGKRRDAHTSESWDVPPGEWLGWILAITPRGYTGHEHVDFAGIIHMNGRIYDPELGRFLQADPFVEDSTTLNRYTYVHNNPLAYTDPSGYMSVGQILRAAVAIVITVYTGGMASGAAWAPVLSSTAAKVAAVAIGGALAGAIQTGSIEGAAWGAFTALVFYGVGKQFGDVMDKGVIDTGKVMKKALAHGIAGGTLSSMQGGKFGHGFMSAGFSAAVSPYVDAQDVGDFAKGVQAALVGGTVSAATGGKFANGAVTAAMQFAFNQMQSPGPSTSGESHDVDRDGTISMMRACGGGDTNSCLVLERVNTRHLREALDYMNENWSGIMSLHDTLPRISFNNTVEYWSARGGSTDVWSGNITLSSGYSSLAELVGTLAHELLHSSDGFWGRVNTNFQDNFFDNSSSPYGVGPRHTELHRLGEQVREHFQDSRGWK